VAIKVPRHQDGLDNRSFLEEARRVAQLRHPSIATVFDVGQHGNRVYIVSDYVEGMNLSQWLQQESYDWRRALGILIDLADALAHAHSLSTIHRDIKPNNIIITPEGRAVLLDFGLGLSDDAGRELPGHIAGTPPYMSPEQAQGRAHRPDGCTDIFSLGVLMYRMLGRKLPFRAQDPVELFRQIREDDPQPLRQLAPGLPPAVEEVCRKAMQKKKERRYRTAADMAAALRTVLAGDAIPSSLDLDSTRIEPEIQSDPSVNTNPVAATQPALPPASPASERSEPPSRTLSKAERRRVTAIQCLIEDLRFDVEDPEQWHGILREIQLSCVRIARQLGGSIESQNSDGVLIYFGIPVAFEDSLGQGVRAALAIAREFENNASMLRKSAGFLPQLRLGVHTGMVVAEEVDDLGHTPGSSSRYTIVGSVARVAAAVARSGAPGQVSTSRAVQLAVREQFEFTPLEGRLSNRELPGGSELFAVVSERVARDSRFATRPATLGRSHELGLLRDLWQQVVRGQGRVVQICAEPGVGKSRLLDEFHGGLPAEVGVRLEARCSAQAQSSPLRPMIDLMLNVLDPGRAKNSAERLAEIEQLCDRLRIDRRPAVPRLAELLGIPAGGAYLLEEGAPERKRQWLFETLLEFVQALSEQRPVVFQIEDLHWIDPSTQEFLALLIDQIQRTPCLLLLTFRPEFHPPWPSRPHIFQLPLNPLGEDQVCELAQRVAGGRLLAPEVRRLIYAKTDGVPLFVEEFTKALQEGGQLVETPLGWALAAGIEPMSIPVTLHDSLVARLHRLGEAREVAQLGSIFGREFPFRWIKAVSPFAEPVLQRHLTSLVNAELLFQRGGFPRARFSFKHALVQDTAYDSLLKATRQTWHARIAEMLMKDEPELAVSQPELLAHHFSEGNQHAAAAPYWLQAGTRAAGRSNNTEALTLLRRGLECVGKIGGEDERLALEFQFQIPLGVTLVATQGYASPEVGPVFEKARDLARRFGSPLQQFYILWGIWAWRVVREELDECLALEVEALSIAEATQDDSLRLEAAFITVLTHFMRGEFSLVCETAQRVFPLYDREQACRNATQTGQNVGVTIQSYWALALWHLGFDQQAVARAENAIDLARELEHPFSLAYALHHAGWLHQLRREPERVVALAEAESAIAEQQGFVFWMAESRLCLACGRFLQGRLSEADLALDQGLEIFQRSGAALSLCQFHALRAQIRLAQGDLRGAEEWISRARSDSARHRNEFHLSEIQRLSGDISHALAPHSPDPAEAWYRQALATAETQQAPAPALRAATSLAALWNQCGKPSEALTLLQKSLSQGESHGCPRDLDEARLLRDLIVANTAR
jgi:class 3 adenylate cyclase/tetratricopeptide (TPR) repeat protein